MTLSKDKMPPRDLKGNGNILAATSLISAGLSRHRQGTATKTLGSGDKARLSTAGQSPIREQQVGINLALHHHKNQLANQLGVKILLGRISLSLHLPRPHTLLMLPSSNIHYRSIQGSRSSFISHRHHRTYISLRLFRIDNRNNSTNLSRPKATINLRRRSNSNSISQAISITRSNHKISISRSHLRINRLCRPHHSTSRMRRHRCNSLVSVTHLTIRRRKGSITLMLRHMSPRLQRGMRCRLQPVKEVDMGIHSGEVQGRSTRGLDGDGTMGND
jgi:hypothetical protein